MASVYTSLRQSTLAGLLSVLCVQVQLPWGQVELRPELAQGLLVLEPVWV